MLFTAPFLLPIICILHHTTVAHPTPPPSCASTASESNSLPLADLQAAAAQIPNNSSAVLLPEKTINWESGSLELTLTQNSTSPIPPPPPEPNTLPPNNATKPTATTWEEVYNATRDMVELCGTRANGFTINGT
ncbi:MAG: hypothetical protein LQ346_007514 [Caloplaca aetnensis]|nr:MAG: hypothetical protein LQ346_007514 [Caloplaca aetnensis]